ncbi:AAA ATPase domain protein [compost metagenome]
MARYQAADQSKVRPLLKFRVQNLGKVKRAEIQLAQLSILVGKNNTGKSYIANLIWAFGSLRGLTEGSKGWPKWYAEFADPKSSATEHVINIDEEKSADIIKRVNKLFKTKGADFLSKVFAFNGFDETSLTIESPRHAPFLVRRTMVSSAQNGVTERETIVSFSNDADGTFMEYTFPTELWGNRFFGNTFFEEIVNRVVLGDNPPRSSSPILYIPAARTGLMLALSSLVTDSLGTKENGPVRELPQPLVAFLRQMARPPRHNPISKEAKQLASWLGNNVAHGTIEPRDAPGAREFKYRPQGSRLELPLHATSSMITELTPFLVSLDEGLRGRHIIFEEPEAHLHLEAQREMARAIARLLSMGAQVTLTTHSDTFVQQINNLMSLHSHPNRSALMERFGYERADLIDPAQVEAYEFQPSSGGTEVRRLERTQEGFVVESLNETLMALATETLALRESVND